MRGKRQGRRRRNDVPRSPGSPPTGGRAAARRPSPACRGAARSSSPAGRARGSARDTPRPRRGVRPPVELGPVERSEERVEQAGTDLPGPALDRIRLRHAEPILLRLPPAVPLNGERLEPPACAAGDRASCPRSSRGAGGDSVVSSRDGTMTRWGAGQGKRGDEPLSGRRRAARRRTSRPARGGRRPGRRRASGCAREARRALPTRDRGAPIRSRP